MFQKKAMEVEQVLHMNQGAGETSYAMNSSVQNKILSVSKAATEEAIVKTVWSNLTTESLSIADLGCSSGPNALLVVSEIVDAVYATKRRLELAAPELKVHLNDLFTNDFNNIFSSLPAFYRKLREENGSEFRPCFIAAVPGSFYGRLFPANTLHFVHSSSSLHWLSQVPEGLEDGMNKGKIYISKSSSRKVVEAYKRQFESDFSVFLKSRSQEMVSGGRMVLSLIGRDSTDPTTPNSCYQWELLAHALITLVSQGVIDEEKVDSFDAPYYAPCMEELKLGVEKEGSFVIERLESYEVDWDGGDEVSHNINMVGSSGERVARTIRAVVESMLASHFGTHIMDPLFQIFRQLVDHHLSHSRTKYTNFVISLFKLP